MQDALGMTPVVSIIIPAYNEEQRLPKTLSELYKFLQPQEMAAEVVVVDDGSTDGTVALVLAYAQSWEALRLVQGPHTGKGGALQAGIRAARGRYVAIADADLSMPASEFVKFDSAAFALCDIIIGSREAPGAHRFNESTLRHIIGRVFNLFVQAFVLPGFKDTQCGFKVLPRHIALELCAAQTITGWGFDVEWIVIAMHRNYRVGEVAVDWYHDGKGSRIHPVRDSIAMFRELLTIRANLLSGRYDRRPQEDRDAANVEGAALDAGMPATISARRMP